MEVTVNGKTYHAAADDADVARCYVCEETANKFRLVCVGPVKDMPGVSIYRCEDCYAGSPKWIKHFMHRSSVGKLFMATEGSKMDAEQQKAIGRRVVEERRKQVEAEIIRRMDEKADRKEDHGKSGSRSMVAPGKKAGARAAVVVQRTRKREPSRSVRISRTRGR